MNAIIAAVLLSLSLFVGMLLLLVVGWRLGMRRIGSEGGDAAKAGTAAVDGAVFALLGLLVAFTFSMPHRSSTSGGILSSPRRTPSAPRTCG
jgi:hypothetical protein